MKKDKSATVGRRSMMSSMGAAALAGIAISAVPASAQNAPDASNAPAGFEPKRHAIDAWMNEMPGDHRVFIDTSTASGGSDALRFCTNILNAHVNAYQGKESDMAMIICYRHASTPYGFNDAMWEKYSDSFFTFTRQPATEAEAEKPKKNTLLSSMEGLAAKGVNFAVCNAATTLMSQVIARATNQKPEDVHAELVANAIPNAHFVPAGVMAVTRSQEYGYSLLYSA